MSEWRGFHDRREAERYALETGLPLGRRVRDARIKNLLEPFFVGPSSPYHYERITINYDRPMAAPGLKSYRYPSRYGGYVMIGAKDNADALKEAARSIDGEPEMSRLEAWDGEKYVPAKPSYPKAEAVAAKADERLNKRAGYSANPCGGHLATLLEFGKVEVGWRESCGSTDYTMHVYREWAKVLKALRASGAVISEEPMKHGNAWATKGGGFWNSIVYRLGDQGEAR